MSWNNELRPVPVSSGAQPLPNASLTSTTSVGLAIAYNVPAGSVDVSASFNGMSLKTHTVTSFAGALTLTFIHP